MNWHLDLTRPRPGDSEEPIVIDTLYQRFNGIVTPGCPVKVQAEGERPKHRIVFVDINNKDCLTIEPDMWEKDLDMWTAAVIAGDLDMWTATVIAGEPSGT